MKPHNIKPRNIKPRNIKQSHGHNQSDKQTILIVDDDAAHRTMLSALLGGWGYRIEEANDGSVAIEKTKERPFDLILMDVRMVKVSGIQALEEIISFNPAVPTVIMTAYSSVETAVNALKKGAYDYLEKPLDFDNLKTIIQRAMEHTRRRSETHGLKEGFDRRGIVGNSPPMTRLLEMVSKIAISEATVLIQGESGTGKELIAGAIHYNSYRKDGPFVKINCAALTDTLLDSELFGHEKGAFTGADRQRDGKFIQSDKGSLFLDEVSEMPWPMQAKLLRALQEREVTRVGGEDIVKVDVRVMAATNKNLASMIREGKFREDLFYRLNVIAIDIPPLKERPSDIPILANRFLTDFAKKNKKKMAGFTPEAMDFLVKNPWPGNVRELMNAIERGVALGAGDYLGIQDFFQGQAPFNAHPHENDPDKNKTSDADFLNPSELTGDKPLREVEREAIVKTLEATGGNKSEAARILGITRKTLYKKRLEYEIEG